MKTLRSLGAGRRHRSPNTIRSANRVAILVVNGFDRRGRWGPYHETDALDYPWIELCLRQVERYSQAWDYEVLVFDNTHLKAHQQLMRHYHRVRVLPGSWTSALGRMANRLPGWRAGRLLERSHPKALDHLVSRVRADVDYIVTLDSDSFPVRSDWLDILVTNCERGASLTGVYRNEMMPTIHPFVHVSGLCVRNRDLRALDVSFGRKMGQDVGQNISDELSRLGRTITPLTRSNVVNFHFLIGGIYGDAIYHHGAGSRRAQFWTSADLESDAAISTALRDAAFRDIDHLIAVLRGQAENDLGVEGAHVGPKE